MLASIGSLYLALVSAFVAPDDTPRPVKPLDSGVTAFVDVTVVTMESADSPALEHATVVVENGRITAIGAASDVKVPGGARRVDGAGKFLVPGLADMHFHMPPGDGAEGSQSWRALTLLLANGVTTVRGLAGHPSHPALREKIAAGEVLGPTFVAAGPMLHDKVAPTVEAAVAAVRAQKEAGFDLVKSHEIHDVAVYNAIQATAREVGLPVAGHVTNAIGLDRAIAAGEQIEHLDSFVFALAKDGAGLEPGGQFPTEEALDAVDLEKLAPLARVMAEKRIWNSPTLALFESVVDTTTTSEQFLARPEMRYLVKGARKQWAAQRDAELTQGIPESFGSKFVALRREIVKALADAGAPLLAGSDSAQHFLLPGFALHDEIEALARAGLTPSQALEAATANPARWLKSDAGVLAVGKRADVLLIDTDPRADARATRAISGVMVRGRFFDRAALDAMLEQVAESAEKS